MTTTDKDFKVKNGIVVTDGGTFGGPVTVGTPTDPSHAVTLDYLDGLSGGMTVSDVPPETGSSGDLWFDSSSGSAFIYYDSYWVEIMSKVGPAGAAGQTGPAGTTVYSELTGTPDLSVYQTKVSGVSDTEIGYLDGVTSAIQTQLADKVSKTGTNIIALTTTTDNDPLTIQSKNGHGGTGFAGILTVENTTTGASNTKKYLRMTSTGAIEFINNAYSATIFSLSDEGNLSVSGTMNGSTLGDTGWQSVSSFNNGYSGANVAYRRINNVVYLRGRVNGGTANASAFNLPSGYRPSTSEVVVPVQQYGTSNINYVTVGTDGNVTPNGTAAWLHSVVYPLG